MSALESPQTAAASWQQIEDLLSSLHELARAPSEPGEFYQKLLEGCISTLAASGGTIWQLDGRGKWQALVSINPNSVFSGDDAARADHLRLLERTSEPLVLFPRDAGGSTTLRFASTRSNCRTFRALRSESRRSAGLARFHGCGDSCRRRVSSPR
jgi:hypothetical protein